jgi:alpha-L-arabinofuranosidase
VLAINFTDSSRKRSFRIEGLAGTSTAVVDAMTAATLDATDVAYNGSTEPSLDLQQPAGTQLTVTNGSFEYEVPALSISRLRIAPAG